MNGHRLPSSFLSSFLNMSQSKILLVGCGSVGTMAAYSLQSSGKAEVTAMLRASYAAVVADGFSIDSVDHGKISGWRPQHSMF